jgi:hypothetical protein
MTPFSWCQRQSYPTSAEDFARRVSSGWISPDGLVRMDDIPDGPRGLRVRLAILTPAADVLLFERFLASCFVGALEGMEGRAGPGARGSLLFQA